MYTVVIVDDEKAIVKGLQTILTREVPFCRVIGWAYDGTEGFDVCSKNNPDIVITDIRMLRSDGLEMIQRLLDIGCKSKFIILSGYSEFEYAKKGIRLGVNFYINKPVEEEELFDCLSRIASEIESERSRFENLKEFVIRDILDESNDNIHEIQDLLELINFPISAAHYTCALIEINGDTLGKDDMENIQQLLRVQFSGYEDVFIFKYTPAHIGVLAAGKDNGDLFKEHLTTVKNKLAKQLQKTLTIGIGLSRQRLNEIRDSFKEAIQALNYKLIKGAGRIIKFSEIDNAPFTLLEADDLKRLEESMHNADHEMCNQIIDDIFEKLQSLQHFSWSDLQIHCLNIILLGVRSVPQAQIQVHDIIGVDIISLEGISRFQTLEQLKAWLKKTLQKLLSHQYSADFVPQKKDVISEVKKYIAENFNQNLSLADLSTRYFLNPHYLSQLFREKTGETYLNYLMRLRVNHAKKLLEETDMKIYEICKAVGYIDTTHFSRLFEKFVGCKPSDYRKNKL